jgi:hypothetical protein
MSLDLGELVGSLRLDSTPFMTSADEAEIKAGATADKVRQELGGIRDVTANIHVNADTDEIDRSRNKISEFKTQAKSDFIEMGSSVGGLLTIAGAAGPLAR